MQIKSEDINHIINSLNTLRAAKLWQSQRSLCRVKPDIQPFISANILGILNHCEINDSRLKSNIRETKKALKIFQKDHLTYHWPIVENEARIANAPVLSRLKFLSISPDADCSCLQQIILNEEQNIKKLIDELIYYRLDNYRYVLPRFQQKLPCTEASFLTWFPPKEQSGNSKIETVDIIVDSNILWFLGKTGHLNIPGAKETIHFIRAILNSDMIIATPNIVSPYYPFPAAILYYISRAIHWGNITELMICRERIIELAITIKPGNDLDRLFLASVGNYWKEESLISPNWQLDKVKFPSDPLYVGSLIMPLALRLPVFSTFMKFRFFNIEFSSRAFQYALMLWLKQTVTD